jgi:hypothetical protein
MISIGVGSAESFDRGVVFSEVSVVDEFEVFVTLLELTGTCSEEIGVGKGGSDEWE